jgi:dTDP-4-dehydrorhamnose 3,5-epimerase
MPFEFHRLELPDMVLVEARSFRDDRGLFLETYKKSEFAAHGIAGPFVQDNWSHSRHGVLRGLHYQKPPQAQGKLVMVLQGTIYDVGVDLRAGSPTFRRWVGVTLRAEDCRLLYIPPGFAHGFCVLSEMADVVYKVTAEFCPDLDTGIVWNDPGLAIRWPIADPILSPKDAGLPLLQEANPGFTWAEPPAR